MTMVTPFQMDFTVSPAQNRCEGLCALVVPWPFQAGGRPVRQFHAPLGEPSTLVRQIYAGIKSG
jgi:hypothetical protein